MKPFIGMGFANNVAHNKPIYNYKGNRINMPNQSDLSKVLEKIQEIVERSADGDYIYRGEAQYYLKVSSGLYRQYGADFGIEDDDIEVIQKTLVVEMAKAYLHQANELEVLTELQHYGGKTNLIDFTTDYLIALFFACDGSHHKDGRIILLKKESEGYEVREPPKILRRSELQKSIFVQSPKGFVEPDDEVTIPKDLKYPILNHLQKYHDISAKHIYNDIHGFIKWVGVHLDAHVEASKGIIFQRRGNLGKNKKEKLKWYGKAIEHYAEALKLNSGLFDVYDKQGLIYNNKGNYDLAIQNYNAAIELNPNYACAYANRGLAYNEKGEVDRAIKDYNKAIDLEPELARVYSNRGVTYVGKGDFDQAFSDFNTAIELDSNDAMAYSNRGGIYLFKGDFERALIDFDTAIELDPDNADNYFNRGNACFFGSHFERALVDFDKVIELRPESMDAYFTRGIIGLHLQKWEKAKKDLISAKDCGMNIINLFHDDYESVEDFEQKNNVQLPEDIKAMLTQR